MNKIEELEKQLKEEMSKIQVDLKEKYKRIEVISLYPYNTHTLS